jgi:TRAP-type mannitol/chloroaromatic compound transport system permease small subunit
LKALFSLQKIFETVMYIVPIAWIYVALMMSVAEASNSNGTVLGGLMTFILYGLLPVGLVLYIMGTPGRKRLLRAREQEARAAYMAQQTAANALGSGDTPDAGGQPSADTVAPVRKEP